ncbi:Zona pellucida-binding protein 1 [Varanus komodoensis]|nr:Zona pellucida-binding protein 1 [Varanus komodoensis]
MERQERGSISLHSPPDTVTDNKTVKITPTGTLLFRHFKYDMSGVYTCSLVFKPTAEQDEKSYLIKYVIYAYSDPNFYYEFSARYHAAACHSIYNNSFKDKLLQILAKLVVELSCEVTLRKSECHHVKMQRAGLQNELFFTFTDWAGSFFWYLGIFAHLGLWAYLSFLL